jgi:hypothetical protein
MRDILRTKSKLDFRPVAGDLACAQLLCRLCGPTNCRRNPGQTAETISTLPSISRPAPAPAAIPPGAPTPAPTPLPFLPWTPTPAPLPSLLPPYVPLLLQTLRPFVLSLPMPPLLIVLSYPKRLPQSLALLNLRLRQLMNLMTLQHLRISLSSTAGQKLLPQTLTLLINLLFLNPITKKSAPISPFHTRKHRKLTLPLQAYLSTQKP